MQHIGKLATVIAAAIAMTILAGYHYASAQDTLDIDIEVVGFDIRAGSKEEKQLREIATAGGGSYVPAEDAQKLMAAVSSTVKKVIADQPSPPPKLAPKSNPRPDFRTEEWTLIEPSDFLPASPTGDTPPAGTAGAQPAPSGGQPSESWESLGGGSSSRSTSESGGISSDAQEIPKTEGPSAY